MKQENCPHFKKKNKKNEARELYLSFYKFTIDYEFSVCDIIILGNPYNIFKILFYLKYYEIKKVPFHSDTITIIMKKLFKKYVV